MDNEYSLDLRRIIDLLAEAIKNNILIVKGYHVPVTENHERCSIYDTSPHEFLSYCRQDLNDNSDRGRTNALSNAKRAIECRTDEILKFLYLKHISSKHRWGLPYKLEVLKTFGITAPNVLINYISSKRNILEHEYVKPKTVEEIQYIADITELFLSASDSIVKSGYLVSIEFMQEVETERVRINSEKDKSISHEDNYKIKFDYNNDLITFIHKKSECNNEHIKRTGEIRSRTNIISEETNNISLHDCKEAEIKELMQLFTGHIRS